MMSAWRVSREFSRAVFEIVGRSPGIRRAGIAREMRKARSTITRALPRMEEHGYLLYEDNAGKLYPFCSDKQLLAVER